jgi:hypothetical protein
MRERYVKKPEHEAKMQAALHAVEKKQLPHMLCVTNMLLHGIEDPSLNTVSMTSGLRSAASGSMIVAPGSIPASTGYGLTSC